MAADPQASEAIGKLIKTMAPYLIIGALVYGILTIIIDRFKKRVDKLGDELIKKIKSKKPKQ
ncbi:MAG: hypothetical protein PHZ07_02245 [Patescibacteria group bacterium]|nr:hypothetical protein [Patescibacteria group bacterium]MDD4304512.1 hypothetical protein [Patescibacteria group bacterium]MDD4694872.1 hypothetical protein [Patescibacteria group bacterium]